MLKIRELHVEIDGVKILNGISIDIPRKAITAILGPNGAGKTTLLRAILGFVKPVRGSIFIDGKKLEELPQNERFKIIAYVPQESFTFFPYKVVDFVVMGVTPYKSLFASPAQSDYLEALNLLKRLGISHLAYRSVTKLSGGEKRLALIARALMQKPRLLLLDEPTSNLDLYNKVKVLQLLQKLVIEEDLTIVFTTHDPNEALLVADKTIILDHGAIVFDGNTSELSLQILEKVYRVPLKMLKSEEGERYISIQWKEIFYY